MNIRDSKYLQNGVLRRGRQPNPTHITGMLINEGDPPSSERKNAMAKKTPKRGPDGRFLPSGKSSSSSSSKGKGKGKGKSSSSRNKNPSKPSSSKGKGKGKGKSSSSRNKNPEMKSLATVEEISELNKAELVEIVEKQQMTTVSATLEQVAVGTAAFLTPGIVETLTKGKLNRMVANLFAKPNSSTGKKAPTYKDYATAKVLLNAGWFGAAWYLTRKGSLAKYRNPVLGGFGSALAVSMVDMMFAPKKADQFSARFRTILGMPPIRPTAYPYMDDGKLNLSGSMTPANQSSSSGGQTNRQNSGASNNSANDSGGVQGRDIRVQIKGNEAFEVGTNRRLAVSFDAEGFAYESNTSNYLVDSSGNYISTGTTALGEVTEYWGEDYGLGNVEEEWVVDGEDYDDGLYGVDDIDIIEDLENDPYAADEAAYGGGSYVSNSVSY